MPSYSVERSCFFEKVLRFAIAHNHMELFKETYIKYKGKMSLVYRDGEILQDAVTHGNLRIVEFMTKEKINLSRMDTIISVRVAASLAHFDILQHLFHCFEVDAFTCLEAMKDAARNHHYFICKYLQEQYCHMQDSHFIERETETDNIINALEIRDIFIEAASLGDHATIQRILERPDTTPFMLKWDIGNNMIIRTAIEFNRVDTVHYLLSLDIDCIDPAACDNYGIKIACENGHIDMVKYLLRLPKRYNIQLIDEQEESYAFIMACKNQHYEVVEYLLLVSKEFGMTEEHIINALDPLYQQGFIKEDARLFDLLENHAKTQS